MEHLAAPIRMVLYIVNFIIIMTVVVVFIAAYYSLLKLFGAYFFVWSLFVGWWFFDKDNSPFHKLLRANKNK